MNASLGRTLRKFNPGTLQSDREVIEQFVVRRRELDIVLDVLRGNVAAPSCQHVLLVGPRGRGKTMLLARAAADLRAGGELSAGLFPVRFMEESLEIFDTADFWLESLFHLSRELAARDSGLARELRDVHAALSARPRGEELLGERARAAVLEASDRLGRKLVLMVENLQMLCGDVDEDFGWKLRKELQSEPRIMLLATATSRFKGLDDAEQPFFELFRIVDLEPLDTEDCRRLWRMATGDKADERKVRPLQILTGGNPRLLIIVAGFARSLSLRRLMEELAQLIDDHTEYFRGHLDVLPKTERRVYLAAVDLWQPSSAGEIAARARLDVRTASTMLGRLIHRGAVTAEGAGRKRLYSAAERLYSIYYKLRRERDEAAVVQNLIRFMAVFYGPEELAGMSGMLRAEAAQWPVIREGIERARAEDPQIGSVFPGVEQTGIEGISGRTVAADDTIRLFGALQAAFLEERFGEVIGNADRIIASWSAGLAEASAPIIAEALFCKGEAQRKLQNFEAAIAAYDEVVERFGNSDRLELQVLVACALGSRGLAQEKLKNFEAALMGYDGVIECFGDSDRPEIQVLVARALVSRGLVQEELENFEVVLAAYDEVVGRFGGSDRPELQVWIARALGSRGLVQEKLHNFEAALAAYDEVVERFWDSDRLELQVLVARVLGSRGWVQEKLENFEAALAGYYEVVERFGGSDRPELHVWIARALVSRGWVQEKLENFEAALAAYDEVVERFWDSDRLELQILVARVLGSRGWIQKELENFEVALAAFDEVVERFGDSDVSELQVWVARALVIKGWVQKELENFEAALDVYDEIVERFGGSDRLELQVLVAMALKSRGQSQEKLGNVEAAIVSYDEIVKRFGGSDRPEIKNRVIMALLAQGKRLESMNAFRSAYAPFDPGNEAAMRQMLQLVPEMIANGASARGIVEILSSDRKKSDALRALVAALRLHDGEAVRAPAEVLEVAADIRKRIASMKEGAAASFRPA